METDIWESEDRDLRVKEILEDLVKKLTNIPKSQKESYLQQKLREVLEENKLID